jgi:hypothetical protein
MYVRWKLRCCKQWVAWQEADVTYSAYLVESKRVAGKPQQKVIVFLGSIRHGSEGCWHFRNLFHDRAARFQFLRWLEVRLDRLELAPEQRLRIVAQVNQEVPPLTPDEQARYEAEEAERSASTAALLRTLRSTRQV